MSRATRLTLAMALAVACSGKAERPLDEPARAPATPQAAARADQERDPLRALAADMAHARGMVVVALSEMDLDQDGQAERVALLCRPPATDSPPERVDAAYLIERGDQRWLIELGETDGRSQITLGATGCHDLAGAVERVSWQAAEHPWLVLRQSHRGGGAECRFAIREGQLVLVWRQQVEDARAGDVPAITDHDHLHRAHGRPYPRAEEALSQCIAGEARVRRVIPDMPGLSGPGPGPRR